MSLSFVSGVAGARKSSMPRLSGDGRRREWVVAGDHDGHVLALNLALDSR